MERLLFFRSHKSDFKSQVINLDDLLKVIINSMILSMRTLWQDTIPLLMLFVLYAAERFCSSSKNPSGKALNNWGCYQLDYRNQQYDSPSWVITQANLPNPAQIWCKLYGNRTTVRVEEVDLYLLTILNLIIIERQTARNANVYSDQISEEVRATLHLVNGALDNLANT